MALLLVLRGSGPQAGRPGSATQSPSRALRAAAPARKIEQAEEGSMDEDRFNMSVRKFLKVVGVTSQREIENAVRDAVKAGRHNGQGAVRAKVTLTVEALGLSHVVEDEIELG
jgi:hypothetical protein